jgi:glutamate---cysteine ligase / carboxylate-amine ligase
MLPPWAPWNGNGRLYTVGVEDEVMLLDPSDWSLTQASDRILRSLSRGLSSSVSPETHASVLELVTGVHYRVSGAVAEIGTLRSRLARELQAFGIAPASAGTHPAAEWERTEVSRAPRYRMLEETMRSLVRREPTMALHVHVGVPDPGAAVHLYNAYRSIAPLLLALSANSPFANGSDTGFASTRRVLFQAFPRTGTPRAFADYGEYVRAVEVLVASSAIPDPSFLWWDLRLQPRLGTVELRIMDAQSAVADIAPLVALVQSFARLVLGGGFEPPAPAPEVAEENAFLAARDGVDAALIDPAAHRLVPVRTLVRELVERCRPHAHALGCASDLEGIERLVAFNGVCRQRSLFSAEASFTAVVAELAARFSTRDLSGSVRQPRFRKMPVGAVPSFDPAS